MFYFVRRERTIANITLHLKFLPFIFRVPGTEPHVPLTFFQDFSDRGCLPPILYGIGAGVNGADTDCPAYLRLLRLCLSLYSIFLFIPTEKEEHRASVASPISCSTQ
jgi:hypothetical protein